MFILFFFCGCAAVSSQHKSSSAGTDQDAVSAVKSLANSLSGKELNDRQIKELSKDIQKNKDTQSAIKSVSDAVGSKNVNVFYCPVDGERFSARVKSCPAHQVLLKKVEE